MSGTTARSGAAYSEPTGQRGTLVLTELWWRDHYYDIEERGYKLRPRYHPRWEPSWFKTGKDFSTVEDGIKTTSSVTMDATRIQDGLPVMLKKITPWDGHHELSIIQQFSSPEYSTNRDNHCMPLLDIIELSGHFGSQQLMVFPLLRPFNRPRIQTFREFVAFFTQICEGIRFMHQQNVARYDCTADDIMFEPSQMYPNGFHPVMIDRNRNFDGTAKSYTRTQRPPRYLFIDFGQSRRYPSRHIVDYPPRGGDKSAPERRLGQRCNPFHTDIYYIGHLVRQEFMMGYNGFEFMEDLVASMTQDNPTERPLIEDVLQEFSRIRLSLSGIKLRFAIISKKTPKVSRIIRQAAQCVRTLGTASSPDWAVETVDIYERSDKRGWLTISRAVRNNIQSLTGSFVYNANRASSQTSVASYKTERSINSRKSRYNALPRRKYAHIERSQSLLSLNVEVPETVYGQHTRGLVLLDDVPLQATVQNLILNGSEARTEVTNIRKRLGAELKPKFAILVEHMYHFNTSQARASIIYNTTRAQKLLSDMNFIYPEPRTGRDPYCHPIIQRSIDTTWFRNRDDIGVVDREHFSPMPISVIAITLTVIEWCIGEWSDGTRRDSSWEDEMFQTVYDSHISSLLDFQAHGHTSNRDVLYQLQCDLSRNALEHAGVPPGSVTESSRFPPGALEALDVVHEEDDDQPSSAASPDYDGDIPSITIDFA